MKINGTWGFFCARGPLAMATIGHKFWRLPTKDFRNQTIVVVLFCTHESVTINIIYAFFRVCTVYRLEMSIIPIIICAFNDKGMTHSRKLRLFSRLKYLDTSASRLKSEYLHNDLDKNLAFRNFSGLIICM
jgi:hypothetical protein